MNPEKLYEAIKDLPEPLAQEVLVFAASLRSRSVTEEAIRANDAPLTSLAGILANVPALEGDPLAIQQRLRDEWH